MLGEITYKTYNNLQNLFLVKIKIFVSFVIRQEHIITAVSGNLECSIEYLTEIYR